MPKELSMHLQQMVTFLQEEFPQFQGEVCDVQPDFCLLRQPINAAHLRPGGTVSGPTLMALADVALYVALLAKIGPVALAATTDFTIHFLNKPQANQDLMAKAYLIKLGKRLAIGEVELYSAQTTRLVAKAVGTYSIPPATN